LFFDKYWWSKNLKTHPPGFFGSGYGVIDPEYGLVDGLGYAKKLSREKIIKDGERVVHLGTKDLNDEKSQATVLSKIKCKIERVSGRLDLVKKLR